MKSTPNNWPFVLLAIILGLGLGSIPGVNKNLRIIIATILKYLEV